MAQEHIQTALKALEPLKAQLEPLVAKAHEAAAPLLAKAQEHLEPLLEQAKPHLDHVWEKVSPELLEAAHQAEFHLEGVPHWQLLGFAFLATLLLVGLLGGAKRVFIITILGALASLGIFYYTEHVHIPPAPPAPKFIPTPPAEPVVHYD